MDQAAALPEPVSPKINASLAVTAVVLTAFVVGARDAPGDARSSCVPKRSRTIAVDGGVRVYSRRVGETEARRYYGCVGSRGRPLFLGPPPQNSNLDVFDVRRFRVADPMVAYELQRLEFSHDEGPIDYEIVVRDLRRRQRVRRVDAADVQQRRREGIDRQRDGVTGLVVTPHGSVAWIIHNPHVEPRRFEVYTADARGRAQVDAGDDIDGHSLSLKGTEVSWRRGGQTKRSTLHEQR